MVRPRHRLSPLLDSVENLLLDIIIVVVETRLRAQLATVLEIPRTGRREHRRAGAHGELDGAAADGARAAPDEDNAVEFLGIFFRAWEGKGEEALLEEAG